ncbi:MAG: mannosyltransferase family protein [Candidatus Flexifilum sp.]
MKSDSLRLPDRSFLPGRSRLILVISIGWAIAVLLFGLWTTSIIPVPDPQFKHDDPDWPYYTRLLTPDMPLAAVVRPWLRWDVLWYLALAQDGYREASFTAFAPLYPAVVRGFEAATFGLLGGNLVLAGMIVNLVCSALVVLGLARLARAHFGSDRSSIAVILLFLTFPTAFYLIIPYTEALYLTLVIGIFLLAERQRWLLAGILAALAVPTRFHGIILIIPLGWIAVRMIAAAPPGDRWRRALRAVPLVIGPAVGAALMLTFLYTQGFSGFTATGARWGSSFTLPHVSLLAYLQRAQTGQALWHEHETAAIIVLMTLLCFAAGWQAVRGRMRPEYALYAIATLGLSLSIHYEEQQYVSVFRHALLLFPCFFILAGMCSVAKIKRK